MITEGDSITHNSVVSDSGRVVSVAHEKVDGVAVVGGYGATGEENLMGPADGSTTPHHDELIRLIHPTCPSHDVDRDVARVVPEEHTREPSRKTPCPLQPNMRQLGVDLTHPLNLRSRNDLNLGSCVIRACRKLHSLLLDGVLGASSITGTLVGSTVVGHGRKSERK